METKVWWKSLTVWSTLATIALVAAQSTLDAIGPGVAWVATVAPYLTTLLALIGRARATLPVTLK